jgi:isoquinoline 1-oxidoreductase beta subunit
LQAHPRHRKVLEVAAEAAGYGQNLPDGHALGLAVQESFGSIVAEVVEVSMSSDNQPIVHKVTCAIDCGWAVNPDGAEAQVESGIIYGLTAALYGEITIENGAVKQSNFNDYQALRMSGAPKIETHIINSGNAIGGAGEPGTPGVAPALANAIYDATGFRVRKLPLNTIDLDYKLEGDNTPV